MVTEYTIEVPCSFCSKPRTVVIKGYCSGACKVKAHRDKGQPKEETMEVLMLNDNVNGTCKRKVKTELNRSKPQVKVSNSPPLKGKLGGTGMFCKNHKAMKIGLQFTCGCIVG